MKMARWLSLALLVLAVLAAGRARADGASVDPVAEAARQFDAGKAAFKAKKYQQAALAFEAAASLRPHPLALFSAAVAWEQADRSERAANDFARALQLEGLSAQDASHAKERVEALERSLGTIAVSGPSGWSAQLENPPAVSLPARLHAAPGVHTLLVVVPDKPVQRRDVSLEAGKTTTLELKDEPPASSTGASTASPPPLTPSSGPSHAGAAEQRVIVEETGVSTRRAVGLTLLGLGLAGIGAGAVLGIETLDGRDAYNTAPSQSLADHVRGLQRWTNIALVAGGVLTLGGGLLVFWPSSSTKKETGLGVAPTLGGAALIGRF